MMFKTSKKQIKQTSQTEKLPNKLKSDVERTFDGIFAHRFLKTYKYNYWFETFICFIRWLSMDCMTPEIVPASHAISRFSVRFCQNTVWPPIKAADERKNSPARAQLCTWWSSRRRLGWLGWLVHLQTSWDRTWQHGWAISYSVFLYFGCFRR